METDRSEFCFMHYAEIRIILLGIKANYPLNINFEDISNHIIKIKSDLQDIINGNIES